MLEELVEHCRQLRVLASHGEEHGVLLHRRVHLSAAQLVELQHLEEATLAQLTVLRDSLGLTPEVVDLRVKLHTGFSLAWSELHDIRPESMIGYGAMDDRAAAILSPAAEQLIGLAQRFVSTLEGAAPPQT
jgi:hypothetical protein